MVNDIPVNHGIYHVMFLICDITYVIYHVGLGDVIYYDIYQVILMCDIPHKTVIYHAGIYHGIYHIWHHIKISKPTFQHWESNPRLHPFQDSVLPAGLCIS